MASKAARGGTAGVNPWVVAATAVGTVLVTVLLVALSGAMAPGGGTDEDWSPALAVHLGTAVPAIPLGAWLLARRKGDRPHRVVGRLWMALMLGASVSSFWLTGLTGGFSPIHVFSVVTPLSIARAVWAARTGNMTAHRYAVIGAYVGLLTAGVFAFVPGRVLNGLLFG